MAVRYISNYDSDGTCVGQAAADKVGFHGKAPSIQVAYVASIGTTSTTTAWKGAINSIKACLVTKGLMAAS